MTVILHIVTLQSIFCINDETDILYFLITKLEITGTPTYHMLLTDPVYIWF